MEECSKKQISVYSISLLNHKHCPQSGPKDVIPLMYVNVVLHIPEFAILKNNSMLIIYYDETKKKTRNIFVKADTSYVSWGDKFAH